MIGDAKLLISIDRRPMDKQLNARISPETYKRVKAAQADSKLTLNTLVERLLEIGLDAYLQGNVATDSNSYVSQVEFESFKGEVLGKFNSLINLPVNQVESIEALVQVANKGIEIENHPKTLDNPLQVANTARTGGKGKPITFDLSKSDGSVVLRSIKGTHPQNFKKLSDSDLASIGVLRRGDKFYPIA